MSVSTRPLTGNGALVEIQGPADVLTASEIKTALLALITEGYRDLVISLEQVDALDCSGLGVLIAALKELRSVGGNMQVFCSQPRLLEIFQFTGLNKVFQMVEDENKINEFLLAAEFPCLECPFFIGIPNCPIVKSLVCGGERCRPGPHLQWLSHAFRKILTPPERNPPTTKPTRKRGIEYSDLGIAAPKRY